MSSSQALQGGTSSEHGESNGQIRKRYEHLRGVSRQLGNRLISLVSKQMMHEGAQKLGILEGETLVFDSEDEMCLLMDYCIYNVRRNGRSLVEQYLLDSPPAEESDEMVCLRAMQSAIYSLLVTESVEPNLGVHVQNLISLDRFLVADIGFSATGSPGLTFASRVIFFPEFAMTGGSALPLGHLSEGKRAALMQHLSKSGAVAGGGMVDPAPLIRECRRQGASSRVAYRDIGDPPVAARRTERVAPRIEQADASPKIGRNDPCPCGSGKKFKHCCLKAN